MTKTEYFEAGYTVMLGSPYGDMVLDEEDCKGAYAEDGTLESVDEEAKVVYFYDPIWA